MQICISFENQSGKRALGNHFSLAFASLFSQRQHQFSAHTLPLIFREDNRMVNQPPIGSDLLVGDPSKCLSFITIRRIPLRSPREYSISIVVRFSFNSYTIHKTHAKVLSHLFPLSKVSSIVSRYGIGSLSFSTWENRIHQYNRYRTRQNRLRIQVCGAVVSVHSFSVAAAPVIETIHVAGETHLIETILLTGEDHFTGTLPLPECSPL